MFCDLMNHLKGVLFSKTVVWLLERTIGGVDWSNSFGIRCYFFKDFEVLY